MGKFKKDAKALLEYVGGQDNIKAVSHCVTRMRFILVDSTKADMKKIESLYSVKGIFVQSGQFQVIIGNEVSEFYKDFVEISGVDGVSQNDTQTNQTWLQKMMGALGEIFAPLIPALICGGIILGLRNIIGEMNFFYNGTQSLADISQFWAGTYSFLWLIGEAIFHLLPVGIVWSITKKMGTTEILGIVLGLTLVSPQLLNGFHVADAARIPVWDFGFTQVPMIGYQGQVIVAMMSGFVLVYLERFFKKITPSLIQIIIVPLCSLVPAVIITHTVIGPMGCMIEDFIGQVIYGSLTSSFGILLAAIFGLLYTSIVKTGLHHITNVIDVILTNMFGGTLLWPMIALSNIAQGSSVLAMSILQRYDKRVQQNDISACISCYLGVTEPALFGVNMKYGFPLVCGMIGSAIAAVISVGFGVEALSIGVGGLPGIISIKPECWDYFLIAMAVAIVIPFVFTMIAGQKKLAVASKKQEEKDFISPMQGHFMPLSEVEDQVFSQGLMGDGFAVELKDGEVLAPFSGEVVMTFPTKHAYGLRREDGLEVLIHIGMDTVQLNGEGFESYVQQGDHVVQGQVLAKVNIDYVLSQGKSVVSPVVFTSGQHIECQEQDVQYHQENIFKWKGENEQ